MKCPVQAFVAFAMFIGGCATKPEAPQTAMTGNCWGNAEKLKAESRNGGTGRERGPTVGWSQQTPQWGALGLFFDGLMLRAARHASGVSWRDLSRGGSWGPPGGYSHNSHGQGAKSVLHRSGRAS